MTEPAPAPDAARRLGPLLLLLAFLWLAGLFGPTLLERARLAADPLVFNDDVRMQIYPFLRHESPQLGRGDYAGDYLLSQQPIGFFLLYRGWALLASPIILEKLLPFLLLAALLVLLGAASRRLAGWGGVWATTAFVLAHNAFPEALTGGLARSFGFPLLALAALALAQGRPRLLALAAALGAAFYPVAGLLAGAALAGWLVLSPASWRGEAENWPFAKRLGLVALAALASCGLLLPPLAAARRYGPQLRPADQAEYPEAGPLGRSCGIQSDCPPFPGFLRELGAQADRSLAGAGQAVLPAVEPCGARTGQTAGVTVFVGPALLAGFALLAWREAGPRRLLLLLAAGMLLDLAARPLAPLLYLPTRYLTYTLPILAALLLPGAAAGLAGLFPPARKRPLLLPAAIMLAGTAWLVLLGGRGDCASGFTIRVNPAFAAFQLLREETPPDALVAGWPGHYEPIECVPYLSRRRAFLTFETHLALHRNYVLELRRRMRALIAAYYAVDEEPLRRLRDEFGVTHLIVMAAHYQQPAEYFAPFGPAIAQAFAAGQRARFAAFLLLLAARAARPAAFLASPGEALGQAWAAGRQAGFAVLRLAPRLAIRAEPAWALLDLRRLPAAGENIPPGDQP